MRQNTHSFRSSIIPFLVLLSLAPFTQILALSIVGPLNFVRQLRPYPAFMSAIISPLPTDITVSAGSSVQVAVNLSQCGDTILLQAGASFPITGRLSFPDKGAGCTQHTTLTTTDPSLIPSALRTDYPNSYRNGKFTRITPAMAAGMPKLVSMTNDPVIFLESGAHHWKFVGLELTNADNGVQHTMLVGDGSQGVSTVPHHLIFDQLFLHPIEEIGDLTTDIQFRSVEMAFLMNLTDSSITRSAVQGFTGHNRYPTPGQYRLNANSILIGYGRDNLFVNNLLESNGQVFLSGEGGVNPEHTATASNVTYTSARLSNTKNLDVGDLFAIFSRRYSDNHLIQHPGDPVQIVPRVGHFVNGKITSINRETGDISYTHLTGGLAYRVFNLNLWEASGGSFTLTWMGETTAPIPWNTTVSQLRAALEALPNLNPEDFLVRSAAQGWPYADFMIEFGRNEDGQRSGQWQYPTPINPVKINFSGLTGYNFQPWIQVHSAENFSPLENSADGTLIDVPDEGARVQWKGFVSENNVFRRNIIAHHKEWTDITGTVKGFVEVKGGLGTLFDGSIFSGEGTGIIWTVRNQGDGGSTPWSSVSGSKVTDCLFDLTGYTNALILQDSTYENVESHHILLSNSLFLNPDPSTPTNPWIKLISGHSVTIDHVTVFSGGRLIEGVSGGPSGNAKITNSIFQPRHYLVPCFDGPGPCWPDAEVHHNLIITDGVDPEFVPSWFETFGPNSAWVESSLSAVGFVNPDPSLGFAGDYRIGSNSLYGAGGPRQGSDGKALGVDYNQLLSALGFDPFTGGAVPSPTPAPSITPTPQPVPSVSPSPIASPAPAPNTISATLVTAPAGLEIQPVINDTILNLATLPSTLSMKFTLSSSIGSMRVQFNGGDRTENVAPYSLAGDENGIYTAASFNLGFNTLTLTPFSEANLGGVSGVSTTITFTVVNESVPSPTPTPTSTPTPAPSPTITPTPGPLPSPSPSPAPTPAPQIGDLRLNVPWDMSENADNVEAARQRAAGFYFYQHQSGKRATFIYTGVRLP